jgi:opacity protein-like surface antigen
MRDRAAARILPALAALAAVLLHADPVDAQVRFGPQLSYAGAEGTDPGFGLGARVQFPMLGDFTEEGETTAAAALMGVVSLDRFFPDCGPPSCSMWEINANGIVPLLVIDAFVPYLGAGVRVSRTAVDDTGAVDGFSDNDFGINLLGGVRHRTSRLFGEVRGSVGGDNDPLVLTVGLLIGG